MCVRRAREEVLRVVKARVLRLLIKPKRDCLGAIQFPECVCFRHRRSFAWRQVCTWNSFEPPGAINHSEGNRCNIWCNICQHRSTIRRKGGKFLFSMERDFKPFYT